jgi:hypothetical protein
MWEEQLGDFSVDLSACLSVCLSACLFVSDCRSHSQGKLLPHRDTRMSDLDRATIDTKNQGGKGWAKWAGKQGCVRMCVSAHDSLSLSVLNN